MNKKKRKIIKIDEEKCDGCGLCLPGCPEGALQIIDGKARLVKESYCDGLGACLGNCPQGALKIEEREAEEYDEEGVLAHLEQQSPELAEKHREHLRSHGLEENNHEQPVVGCPSQQVFNWLNNNGEPSATVDDKQNNKNSNLNNWPVKLYLIPPTADFLKNADLIFVADCVPFACSNFHNDLIKGKVVAAGCPKFDDVEAYKEKIYQILESVNIKSITVAFMEITCCSSLEGIIKEILENSSSGIPLEVIKIGVDGNIIKREATN